MRGLARLVIASGVVLAALAPATASGQPTSTTLREVLSDCGCAVAGMPSDLLATSVTDSTTFKDDQGFVVAYSTDRGVDDASFHVIAGDVARGRWRHGEFMTNQDGEPAYRPGPLWDIRRSHEFIFVGLRVAIDGIATSILTPDLKRIGATYGRVLAVLPNGLFLHEEPQPHFAPTHWLVMRVLDTKIGIDALAYPVKPYDPVRQRFIAAERIKYRNLGRRWCREHNHYCDPELFDSEAWFGVDAAVDEATGTVALGVRYASVDEMEYRDVVVTCGGITKIATIHCRESPIEAWTRLYPGASKREVLERAAMQPRRVAP